MILNSVKIHNFKAISHMDIEFQPGVNLLIGDNGVGKTSALEAITVGLSAYFSGVAGVRSRGVVQKDVRFKLSEMGEASATKVYYTPSEIGCSATLDGKEVHWTRFRENELGTSRTLTDATNLKKNTRRLINDPESILPVIAYQSASRIARIVSIKREDYAAHMKKLNDRRAGYIGCIDDTLDAKAINAWCLKMEMAEFRFKREIHEYKMFKSIVLQFMSEMEESNKRPCLLYDTNENELVYGFEEEVYPISALSAGYQSILWIIMDLAYRNSILNPTMKDPKEINGIVLIDEIDMHLHPKWQWKVIPALEKVFPGIQFVIATHSPIVISSCKNANLVVIHEDRTVTYEDSAYAYSIQQVVELIQGSDAVPSLLRQLSSDFDDALNRENYKKAESILNDMRAQFGASNAEVQSAEFELEMSAEED